MTFTVLHQKLSDVAESILNSNLVIGLTLLCLSTKGYNEGIGIVIRFSDDPSFGHAYALVFHSFLVLGFAVFGFYAIYRYIDTVATVSMRKKETHQ